MSHLTWAIAVLLAAELPGHAQHAGAAAARSSRAPAADASSCSPSWLPWAPSFTAPTGAAVEALAVFDDGTGKALYVGGRFASVEGVAANGIAKWDGAQWSAVGSGVAGGSLPGVLSLQVFDDGTGEALYAGGAFTSAGGVPASNIARWNGAEWSVVGGGLPMPVLALSVVDLGTGPMLAAGGYFWLSPGAATAATWDGSGWTFLPLSYPETAVTALAAMELGGQEVLVAAKQYVCSLWDSWGYYAAVETWDGNAWKMLGSWLSDCSWGSIDALAVHDDGTGSALYAGGDFVPWFGVPANVARWDGENKVWSALGGGLPPVHAFAVHDDGSGAALYAAYGWAAYVGGGSDALARWDGSHWSFLGSGFEGGTSALCAFDDGNGGGNALWVGGGVGGSGALAAWGCSPSIAGVPGCFGNPAALLALSGAAKSGSSFDLQLQSSSSSSGTALLLGGADGADLSGCGLLVPGLGEILLALVPAPVAVAQAALAGGVAAFSVPVPADPALVGLTVLLQGASVALLPEAALELSTGLSVTITG